MSWKGKNRIQQIDIIRKHSVKSRKKYQRESWNILFERNKKEYSQPRLEQQGAGKSAVKLLEHSKGAKKRAEVIETFWRSRKECSKIIEICSKGANKNVARLLF